MAGFLDHASGYAPFSPTRLRPRPPAPAQAGAGALRSSDEDVRLAPAASVGGGQRSVWGWTRKMTGNANVPQRRWWIASLVVIVACFTASAARADYPQVTTFVPATTVYKADRPNDIPIDSIMIHDTETSYQGTISAFTGPTATSAVQYVVSGQSGSSDPPVTQFAADKDWTRSVNNW